MEEVKAFKIQEVEEVKAFKTEFTDQSKKIDHLEHNLVLNTMLSHASNMQ